MKIKIEHLETDDLEVVIRGNPNDNNMINIIKLFQSSFINSKIFVQDNDKEIVLNISEILYFEIIDRKVFARTIHQKIKCKYLLSDILFMFNKRGIVQIAKSTLVNIHHVQYLEAEFSGNYLITLSNSERLLVSRFYLKDFRKAIMEV